jgi:hypothetical protein
MYIFISLVYFLLLLTFKPNLNSNSHPLTPQQKIHLTGSLKKVYAANPQLSKRAKDRIERRIKHLQKPESNDLIVYDNDETDAANKPKNYNEYLKAQAKLNVQKRDNAIERFLIRKNFSWKEKEKSGMDVKEILFEFFMHNISKVMFVLLPIFALILKVAFNKNRKFYVEHLIFSIHFHCFFYLFSTLIILFGLALPDALMNKVTDVLAFITVVTAFWYLYRALKTVYNRSRFRTITKMIGITAIYSFTLLIAFCGLLVLTIILPRK